MKISLIAAMAENRVIGCGGKIPWDLPEDRALFRRLTVGHTVVLGRKTFESIGKPLPERRTIVFSRSAGAFFEGSEIVRSLEDFLALSFPSDEEVFVAGGEQIYRLFLPCAASIRLTIVEGVYDGDARFPELDPGEWQEVSKTAGKKCEFLLYRRFPVF